MNTTKIKVEATILASVEFVWNAYNQAEHIVHWNFANDDWSCPSAHVDFRPGGKYSARMEAKDGSFGFDFELIYDEIIEYTKLNYTMLDSRKAEVLFEEDMGSTHVSVTFEAENQNPIEMQQQGWQAILNNFKRYVESIAS